MSSCSVCITPDVDKYRGTIRPEHNEFVVTGRGLFSGIVTRVDLPRVWVQEMRESLPRSWLIEMRRPRQAICFAMAPGPAVAFRGADLQPDEVTLLDPSSTGWQRTSGASHLASISLAVDDIAELGPSLVGRDLPPRRDCHALRVAPELIGRLRRLHAAVSDLARKAPEVIQNPQAARGLDQTLAEAMIACLAQGKPCSDTSSQRRRAAIVQRFRRLVEETNSSEVLYLTDVCTRLSVPWRTLQVCCQEHLGTSPKRYLMLRRMQQARCALLHASAAEVTVTEVATRFGFWELGRFAVKYKQLFGESPAATLHALP